mmetsp:Transcript_28705/g.59554  ORF Transcript_28705/g.59554 Transcript_28705/m.59554 type:complete len:207 (-) Transcript_28705:297-917(-)
MIRQCSSQLVKRLRWHRVYLTQESPFAKIRSYHSCKSSAKSFALLRQNSCPRRSTPTIQVQSSFLPRTRSFDFDKASFHSSPASHASSDAQDVIDSAAATTKWKRNQYRKMQDKFVDGESKQNGMAPNNSLPPLTIDNYDDVQPMWKEMESRVTRRRSLTLAQRGGVSGRRNIRKSDEDVWMAAGVYDIPDDSNDDEADESGETKK